MSLIERRFKELADRLKHFTLEYNKLQRTLERKDNELELLHQKFVNQTKELDILKSKYNKIRVAKSISEMGDDPVKVREKVNELIRGIDKCIARLNK